MTVFRLPDLGEGLDEAEIVRWHVNEGDHVVADQVLVAVETAKAVVEIPAPVSGRVVRLHGAPGDRVKVGAPLAEFDSGIDDKGAIVGELGGPTSPSPLPPPRAPAPVSAMTAAAPAVRARARELGIELATLRGSGPGGAITTADVDAAATSRVAGGEPLRGVRRAMAGAMARFAAEVAPATVTEEADVDSWPAEPDVTARLIRAIAAGVAASPILNAWFDARAMRLDRRGAIDVGLAVDTADGLLVPVLRDVARTDMATLRSLVADAKRAARARSLAPSDMAGPTITLSNHGTLGGIHAALAIVPPQVAILGAGRILRRLVLADGRPAERRVLPLSLTFDHRVITGGDAAKFLRAAVSDLERPE